MGRLFKAFLFRISKDLAFRITLIIGAGLAVLTTAPRLRVILNAQSLLILNFEL